MGRGSVGVSIFIIAGTFSSDGRWSQSPANSGRFERARPLIGGTIRETILFRS
jgi:hypothetical protein